MTVTTEQRHGPGRVCGTCGEPVTAHTLRNVSAHERVLITRNARSRAQANAQVRAAQRVCPLLPVFTPAEMPQRWAPARLVGAGIRSEVTP